MSNKTPDELEKEKQLMWETLKFQPTKVFVQVYGYGGENRFIRSNRQQYQYFISKNLSIDEYADDWDDTMKVPEEMQPFPPGAPYDVDILEASCGATFDDSSTIEITNSETNETIFRSTLDHYTLTEAGVDVEEVVEFYPESDCKKGDVLVWYGSGEKGTFFGMDLMLNEPFNPKKLKIQYVDIDGWAMLTSIDYDGEALDNNDYSTTGKWSECKWIIVGEDTDEVNEPKVEYQYPMTEWYPIDVKPVRKGVYLCKQNKTDAWPFDHVEQVEYTGRKWKTDKVFNEWRGLTIEGYNQMLKENENG